MQAWDRPGTQARGGVAAPPFNLAPVAGVVWAAGCPVFSAAPGASASADAHANDANASANAAKAAERVSIAASEAWLDHLQVEAAAKRLVLLLSPAEQDRFEEPPGRAAVRRGMEVTAVDSLRSAGAWRDVLAALQRAEDAGEAVVVVCASGQVRSGSVAALWVQHREHVTLAEAVRIVREGRAIRRPSLRDMFEMLGLGDLGEPRRDGRGSLATPRLEPGTPATGAWGTPREAGAEVLFVTTGGTIDKDYPRVQGGYAFEIGEPAVGLVLRQLREVNAVGFSYAILSVCRKDSQDITDADRARIVRACRDHAAEHVVVTHGTDTMIESAEYVARELEPESGKRVVFTGAVRPQRFAVSDAAVNIGCALGALWTAPGGAVLLCMNGRVLDARRGVQRDPKTGIFSQTEV